MEFSTFEKHRKESKIHRTWANKLSGGMVKCLEDEGRVSNMNSFCQNLHLVPKEPFLI